MIRTLLHILPLPKEALARALLPLMTVPVEPDLAPYLVSSLKGVTWVPHASKNGDIRTAFRPRELAGSQLETEVVEAVFARSKQEAWGNVHPATKEGVKAAREYLGTYGLTEVEVLANPVGPMRFGKELPVDAVAAWVPGNLMVFVPKDRRYLGTLHVVSRDQVAAVVHNPSRGMAFCVAPAAYGPGARVVDPGTG